MKARTTIWGRDDVILADLLGEREWIIRTGTKTRIAAVYGDEGAAAWPEDCRTQFGFAVRV